MTIQPICYPPAAANGGPLETAPPKVGEFVWQPKVDDWRAVIHTPSGTCWNQYGKLSSISGKFQPALDRLKTTAFACEWLDVGMMEQRHDKMRGCIIIFDLIEAGVEQWQRYARLKAMFPMLPALVSNWLKESGGQVRDEVRLISQWQHEPPMELYRFLQGENASIGHKFYEGVIAKKRDSLYTFGRKPKQVTPDWIKARFDQ